MWLKGAILPFPKKGDVGSASNYRGTTLRQESSLTNEHHFLCTAGKKSDFELSEIYITLLRYISADAQSNISRFMPALAIGTRL